MRSWSRFSVSRSRVGLEQPRLQAGPPSLETALVRWIDARFCVFRLKRNGQHYNPV